MPTSTPLPTIRAGKADNSQTHVDYLRACLISQGVLTKPSGVFDAALKELVIYFQMTHQDSTGKLLTTDGEVGPKTWWALTNPSGAAQRSWLEGELPKGLSSARRKILSAALKDHKAGVKEVPDGSNYGGGVERYLHGVGPAFWCFTGDQEILTQEHGWVRLDALGPDHGAVAQVNDALELSFADPSAYICKFHQGELITSVQSKGPQFTCDPDHRFFGKHGKKKTNEFYTIGSLTQPLYISACHKVSSEVDLNNDDLEFLGAFLADGTGHGSRIVFNVQRERKVKRLRRGFGLHSALAEREDKAADGDTRWCFTFAVPDFFEAAFESYKTLDPAFITALNADQAEALLRGFQAFDGTQCVGDGIWIHTAREHHADLLLTLGVLAGYHPKYRKRIQPENSFSTGNTLHWVRMSKQRQNVTLLPAKLLRHTGDVPLYCVTVPDGRIVVRGANRVPFVTGNCCYAVSEWVHDGTGSYPLGQRYGLVSAMWNEARRTGRAYLKNTKCPVPGDVFVLLYRNNAGKLSGAGHTGLVAAVGNDMSLFNTIEGNMGNRVKLAKRTNAESLIVGFIDVVGDSDVVRGQFSRGLLTASAVTSDLKSTR